MEPEKHFGIKDGIVDDEYLEDDCQRVLEKGMEFSPYFVGVNVRRKIIIFFFTRELCFVYLRR